MLMALFWLAAITMTFCIVISEFYSSRDNQMRFQKRQSCKLQ
jgi:hypothetical protein